MNQTQTIISTYTADVSGVCSALFELGGMTIMHDASGCNSTYNTHDEPRWYNNDSLVFISGLSEMEAVMGDDNKMINDIIDAANELHPEFIAIAGTPIPMMTGCDIPAIARAIEKRTGIPSFGFQTNGMHSYISGAGMALAEYAKRMTYNNVTVKEKSVNIIGATPLDFSINGSVDSMKKMLTDSSWNVIATWAMESTIESIKRAGEASVNLVVSSVGIPTAKELEKKFGTPYVICTPTGKKLNEKILGALSLSANDKIDRNVFDDYTPEDKADIYIIGESVMSRSLAFAINLEYKREVKVICPVEVEKGILSNNDRFIEDEVEIKDAIKDAKIVIADPLYKPIINKKSKIYEMPHEAFSGRIFRKNISDIIEKI